MSKFVLCWLHHCTSGERSKCGPITSLKLCKRKLGVKFISSSEEYGEPVALLSSKRKSGQEAFSDREDFSSEHQQVVGNKNLYSDSLIWNFLSNHSLKNMEIICLRKQNLKS